ncbi:unnamed protein product [Caenorhabditis bovis]|uniref:RRM domain-containing protein n=1 Tax=Caenorhabditis bovis TaxID=2654633 RepID=A0A8S1EZH5_9PELO|nr:unnamed protein product [Caenorhabditis bovis]
MTDVDESVLLADCGDISEEPIDESALLDQHDDDVLDLKDEIKEDPVKDEIDLYDDAIAPTNAPAETVTTVKTPVPPTSANHSAPITKVNHTDGKKYCCYVGNLTWYATDADLLKLIASIGIDKSDYADCKFFENRTNGQSKGYALLVFNSDSAVKTVMEILPTKSLHGQSLIVLSYSKTNQAKLEEAQIKNQTRPDVKKKTDDGCLNMGTIRIGSGTMMNNRGGMQQTQQQNRNPPPLMMQNSGTMMRGPQPLMNTNLMPQNTIRLQINGQPSQVPMLNRNTIGASQSMMGNIAPSAMPQQNIIMQNAMSQPPRPLMSGMTTTPLGVQQVGMSAPPPTMIGQQFIQNRPPQYGQPIQTGIAQPLMSVNTAMRPPTNGIPPPVHVNPQMFPGVQAAQGAPLSDAEFEEIMNRNITVSSSAIGRAVADASAGDIKGARETLITAIELIRKSRIGSDERCRGLVQSLDETLRGIESRVDYSRGKSYRDRSRSRDRERKRRRRSRTRSYSRSPSPHRSRRRY